MNWWIFWGSEKLGIYNPASLRKALGLDHTTFKRLMQDESKRCYDHYRRRFWEEYYQNLVKENPDIKKYGLTPMFPNHPFKSKGCIFNDKSGVFLEKTWSMAHKNNMGKSKPYNFRFMGG